MSIKIFPVFIVCIVFSFSALSQINDSVFNTGTQSSTTTRISLHHKKDSSEVYPLKVKDFIIPGALIGFGTAIAGKNEYRGINANIKNAIWDKHPHGYFHADDYLIYVPAATVYLLNACGVKGKHDFKDRTIIYAMSNLIVTGIVLPTKNLTERIRPDGSNNHSFPSGHTAGAFAAAEFMRLEYKDVSGWLSISGYATAIATGYLRMYNNKHWFSDVVAGAGIGILSTRLSYWLYPKIKPFLFKNKKSTTLVLPSYSNGIASVQLSRIF